MNCGDYKLNEDDKNTLIFALNNSVLQSNGMLSYVLRDLKSGKYDVEIRIVERMNND